MSTRILKEVSNWLKALFSRDAIAREVNIELEQHIEFMTADNVAKGMGPTAARRAAMLKFGGVERYREESRDSWGTRILQEILQDIRYSARQLNKARGFAIVSILTLAIGIGSVTAIYSLVYSTVLKPLPYLDPEQLVTVNEIQMPEGTRQGLSQATYLQWQEQATHLESIAMVTYGGFNVTGVEGMRRSWGMEVTSNLFTLLGAQPMLGRNFRPDEDTPGKSNVLILSHNLWQTRFASNPEVIDRGILINGRSMTIIGVMPASFQYAPSATFFMPLTFTAASTTNFVRNYGGVGRLKPGVTLDQANAQIDAVSLQLAQAYPEIYENFGGQLRSLQEVMSTYSGDQYNLLLAAVGCLLLIACTNIANLLLARSTTRQAEIAVRTALGASRGRIIRQLLGESLLLAVVGGGLGLLVGQWSLTAIIAFLPANTSRIHEITMDGHAVVFSLILTVFTGIIFGLMPALQASKVDLNTSLKDSGRRGTNTNGSTQRLRSALVITEVALALILLSGAGLFFRSMTKAQSNELGFETETTYLGVLLLDDEKYPTDEKRVAVVDRFMKRTAQVPGVADTAFTSRIKPSDTIPLGAFTVAGRPAVEESQRPRSYDYGVSPGYFNTLKIPLLRGRIFGKRDTINAPKVAVINREMAQTHFADEDPIGQLITVYGWRGGIITCEIVGIVGNTRQGSLMNPMSPQIYQPYAQIPMGSTTFLLRRTGATLNTKAVLKAIYAVDPDAAITALYPMTDGLNRSLSSYRSIITIFGVFSVIALLLAAMGIYGVMAYNVSQRTGEIGVRMALGASQTNILKIILAQGSRLTAIGLIIGLLGAIGLGRFISSRLYDTSPYDPVILLTITSGLGVISLLACYLPARRATKVDPMVALRTE